MKVDKQLSQKILKLIQNHVGKSTPIQVDEIISKTGSTDREVRRIVQYLINVEGNPIGSTTRGPFGFYIIANEEDFAEAIKNLGGRDKEIVKRILKLHENCKKHGIDINEFKNEYQKNGITININNLFITNHINE